MTEANMSVLTVETALTDSRRLSFKCIVCQEDDDDSGGVACRMRVAGRGEEKRKYSSVMQITNKRLQSAENDEDGGGGDALGGNV